MAERNEVRVSDQDLEMLAIKAMVAALDPLTPSARERVMKWTESRYGTSALVDMMTNALQLLSGALDELAKSARLHQVSGEQMRAIADRIMIEAASIVDDAERPSEEAST
jgi:hypothetical protein